jgi:hypothetical protein
MSSSPTAARQRPPASHNLVELVKRHHAERAPTARQVLKDAIERRGEIADDDRRASAKRSGLPESDGTDAPMTTRRAPRRGTQTINHMRSTNVTSSTEATV